MNTPIVADSSGFVSLASGTDSNHALAVAGSVSIQEQHLLFIIPGEIITETINVIGKKIGHAHAMRLGRGILDASALTIVETTAEVRNRALELFEKQASSTSFTDCLVMAVADAYDTRLIFGYDEVFRKNGYIRFGLDDQKSTE